MSNHPPTLGDILDDASFRSSYIQTEMMMRRMSAEEWKKHDEAIWNKAKQAIEEHYRERYRQAIERVYDADLFDYHAPDEWHGIAVYKHALMRELGWEEKQ